MRRFLLPGYVGIVTTLLSGPLALADERDDRILALQDQNAALMQRIQDQEARLSALEQTQPVIGASAIPAVSSSVPGKHGVYGRLRLSMSRQHTDMGSTSSASERQDENAHLLGFKGHWGGEELRALYNIQVGVDADTATAGDVFTRRFAYAGLSSQTWGTLLYGSMSAPYKSPGVDIDQFYDTPVAAPGGAHHFGLSSFNSGWINNSVSYTSPSFSGFNFQGAVFKDDSDNPDDGWNVGIGFEQGAFKADLQMIDASTETGFAAGDARAQRVVLAYTFQEKLALGASWEHVKPKLAESQNLYYGVASYPITHKIKLSGALGFVDGGVSEGVGISLGTWYSVLPSTYIYAVFGNINQSERVTGASDWRTVGVGVHHAFGFGN